MIIHQVYDYYHKCDRENIWILQLNIADSKKNIIVYYALRGSNWTFHVECDGNSISRRRVPYTSHETTYDVIVDFI